MTVPGYCITFSKLRFPNLCTLEYFLLNLCVSFIVGQKKRPAQRPVFCFVRYPVTASLYSRPGSFWPFAKKLKTKNKTKQNGLFVPHVNRDA